MPVVGLLAWKLQYAYVDCRTDMQMSQSDVDQINDDIDVDEESTQQEDAEAPRAAVTAPEEDGPVDDKDVEVEEEELPEVSAFPTLVT